MLEASAEPVQLPYQHAVEPGLSGVFEKLVEGRSVFVFSALALIDVFFVDSESAVLAVFPELGELVFYLLLFCAHPRIDGNVHYLRNDIYLYLNFSPNISLAIKFRLEYCKE